VNPSQHHIFIDSRFAAHLADNAVAVRDKRADGSLPDYPLFVDRLFKELLQVNAATMIEAINRMAHDTALCPDGKLNPAMVTDMVTMLAGQNPNGSAMHAAIGCAGEGGELLDCVKKVFIYGKDWCVPDAKTGQTALENLLEELGDFRFYYQKLLNMLGISDEDVQAANFVKLSKRYASGHYTDAQALGRADKAHEPQFIGDKSGGPASVPRNVLGRRKDDHDTSGEANDEHGPEGHHNLG
jgi:hypothetical protein